MEDSSYAQHSWPNSNPEIWNPFTAHCAVHFSTVTPVDISTLCESVRLTVLLTFVLSLPICGFIVGQQSKYYSGLIENLCNPLVATLESPVPNFVSVRWKYTIMTLILIDANISGASANI
jgi:hypothetical protein